MASIKDLQDQMNKNSAAWHGASQAEKDRLHQENKKLQQQIDSMSGGSSSFNSSTGKWTTTGGSSGGGSTGSSNNGGGSITPSVGATAQTGSNWASGSNGYGTSYGTDANGQRDYSVEIRDAMNAGADWETVQDLLNKRTQKAEDMGYTQWKYDDLYKQAQEYIDNNSNLYQKEIDRILSGFDTVQSQQEAAQQAAVDQAVNQLTGQKTGIEQSYDNLYRQLYLDRRRAEKNLPQQLAAMGITGGMAEGTALGIQTSYTDALRQGEQQKLSTLNDIDQAIADARLTGDIGIAQQAAQLAMDKLATYGNLITQMQNQQNYYNDYLFNKEQADIANNFQQQYLDRQALMDQYERNDISRDQKLQIAQYLYENTGDASLLREFGLTDAQIALMGNNWYANAMQQAMSSKSRSNSGNDSDGNDGPDDDDGKYTGDGKTQTTTSPISNGIDPFNVALGTIGTVLGQLGNAGISASDSGLSQLQSELNRIQDTSNPSAVRGKAAKIIQQYYERGSITEETAKKLLSQYGIPT